MEVTLDRTQIDNLKEFVDHLSRTMHFQIPGSLVIWSLPAPNSLLFLNLPFFSWFAACLIWLYRPGMML